MEKGFDILKNTLRKKPRKDAKLMIAFLETSWKLCSVFYHPIAIVF